MPALSLAALGVVFGDIGTSPLYTLKTVLDVAGDAHSEPVVILGALSLILWTLFVVTLSIDDMRHSDARTQSASGYRRTDHFDFRFRF
jgi:hypothetical protein